VAGPGREPRTSGLEMIMGMGFPIGFPFLFSTECAIEKILRIGQYFGKDMEKSLWLTFLGPACISYNA